MVPVMQTQSKLWIYTPELRFSSYALAKSVERYFVGKSTMEQRWLGVYYAKEIAEGITCPLQVVRVCEQIGDGVLSTGPLRAHAFVAEYVGVVRRRCVLRDRKNDYCFDYAGSPWVIDAELYGNSTRFINHSDRPNLEPVAAYAGGVMHIILRAKQEIAAGEQLSYDYGDLYWKRREAPLPL
jgi:uncharacterized protein